MTEESKGILYIVSTPIGNLGDVSYRAIEILQTVDLIAAEDTRHSKRLLDHYQIKNTLISLHDHNESARIELLKEKLSNNKNLALISDAGTPLISDPGYRLVKTLVDENYKVVPVPGACAAIAALSASGLTTDKFRFEGFLSAKAKARLDRLQDLESETVTMVFYEAPHRLLALLQDVQTALGESRLVCLARELTKTFETIKLAPVAELISWVSNDENQQKGECVLLVSGKIVKKTGLEELKSKDLALLRVLAEELPPKKAANIVAAHTGISKKNLYEFLISEKDSGKNSQ